MMPADELSEASSTAEEVDSMDWAALDCWHGGLLPTGRQVVVKSDSRLDSEISGQHVFPCTLQPALTL